MIEWLIILIKVLVSRIIRGGNQAIRLQTNALGKVLPVGSFE